MSKTIKIFSVLQILFLVIACNTKTIKKGTLKGEIKSLTIQHSTLKNELCDDTRFIFQLELTNNTSDTLSIDNILARNQLCRYTDISSTLRLKPDSSFTEPTFWKDFSKPFSYDMALLGNSTKSKMILPNSKAKIECVLLTTIYGASLKHVMSIHEPLLNSSFTIETSLSGKKVSFLKKKNWDVILKLNGEIVMPSDTTKMNQVSDIYKIPG